MYTVTGLFLTVEQARWAIDTLLATGFDAHSISIVASPTEAGELARTTRQEAPPGSVSTAGAGALLGGLTGGIIGPTGLVVTGAGLVAAGPLGALLSAAGAAAVGTGAGAAAGGLLDLLTRRGFSAGVSRDYEERVAQGDVLIAVDAHDHAIASRVAHILQQAAAVRVTSGSGWPRVGHGD